MKALCAKDGGTVDACEEALRTLEGGAAPIPEDG